MNRYFIRQSNPGRDSPMDQFYFSKLRFSGIGLPSLNNSVKQIKKRYQEKTEFAKALKRLDISPNPLKHRNPFCSSPESLFKSTLKPNKFTQNYDIDEFIDAMFFRVNNPYLMVDKDFGAPMDFFTAEIQIRNLKNFRPVVRGVEINDVDQTPLELYWLKYISSNTAIRWDIFEEAICRYFIIYINQSIGKVRKIDWDILLQKLYKKLACLSDEPKLWPGHPGLGAIPYKIPIVTLQSFQNYIASGKLKSLVLKSIRRETYYITERYKKQIYMFACGTEYKGSWKNYLRDGLSKMTYKDYFFYDGYFFKGLRHGYGLCKADETVYKGYWDIDFMDGPGEITYFDQSSISGMWKKGNVMNGNLKWAGGEYEGYFNSLFFEGSGILTTKNGDVKKGNWVKGKLNGNCEVLLKNKSTLKGFFVDDLMEGDGFIDGPQFMYTGQVKDSLAEGTGSIVYKLKPVEYNGQFIAGAINGSGTYKIDNDIYKGEFVHGKLTGKGEKLFSSIAKYFGEFSNSLFHGKGVLRINSDLLKGFYSGEFSFNKFQNQGRLKLESGDYKGSFANGQLHGNGELTLEGMTFKGYFSKSEISSKGSIHFADGSFYNGEFIGPAPFGNGEALDTNGYWIAANFIDGKPSNRHRLKNDFFINLQKFKEKFERFLIDLNWINDNLMVNNFI